MPGFELGSRWRSAVCDTEIVVVRSPAQPVDLRCGGSPVLPHGSPRLAGGGPVPGTDSGTRLGKRYVDPDSGLEVLCTKGGRGAMSIGDLPLEIKSAKPLPASD